MDAEFIQSTVRVGDYVEIILNAGSGLEGFLSELTLTRLTLTLPDGRKMAVALPAVVTVAQKLALPKPGLPTQTPAAIEELPVPPPPHPDSADLAMKAPAPWNDEVSSAEPASRLSEISTALRKDVLEQVSALQDGMVDMDIYVHPADRGILQQIRNSYDYALKINELDPKYGRIQPLYHRALQLWNSDQENPELTRMVGALALLKGDVQTARRRFAQSADFGDVLATRLLAITGALLEDPDTVVYGLLQYFRVVAPDADMKAWSALVAVLDARGSRGALAELLDSQAHDKVAREAVRTAMGQAVPDRSPMQRPALAVPQLRPADRQATPVSTPPARTLRLDRPSAERPVTQRSSDPRQMAKNPYQYAKYLEHRVKDLPGAQAAYRQAIKNNDRRASAVKDLAWITKRLDGSEAALKVIEQEFSGIVQPGNTLDNILIDFLPSARRYDEALEILYRQHNRPDITSSRRYHLAQQIAYVKLASGKESVSEWRQLLEQSPYNQAVQRGMAMALIQRGTPADLDEAETLIADHSDDRAVGIRQQIAKLRQGGQLDPESAEELQRLLLADAELPDPTPPLVIYVLQNFSDLARVKDQGDRDGKTPTRDLVNVTAEMGRQMAGKQPENSARAYISAAVLARELGIDDVGKFMYRGLTALAEVVLGRQEQDSARDLYCAALAAADDREDSESSAEVRSGVIGYLRLLSGRTAANRRRRDRDLTAKRTVGIADVLEEELAKHGPEVFGLIPPLLADTSMARDLVLDAICSREGLRTAAADFLAAYGGRRPRPDAQAVRTAWQHAVEQWSKERRRLTHSLAELQYIAVSENALESVLHRLEEFGSKAPNQMRDTLIRVEEALSELRRYISEPSYEERMACLRFAGSTARALRADVARGPTSLSVELVEPVAERIEALVKVTQQELDENQAPQPDLTLALEQSSANQEGAVTVQIKVSNELWRAPLDSPELSVRADPDMFEVDEQNVRLATSVRGGDYHIQRVRLLVTRRALASGAFSMPVVLRYRSRSREEFITYEAALPVRLAREDEFEAISPNPFQDGATGRPVINPDMFFGRDDLINRIRDRLCHATSPGIGVAVFGQKRAGKSSIRLHLTQRLEEHGLPVVDIGNIGDLSPEPGDQANTRLLALLMWRVLDGANSALVRAGAPGLIPPDLDRATFMTSPEPVYDCAKYFEDHRRSLAVPVKPMTVLIDEFQFIDQWTRMGLLSPSFMQAFKALIERRLFHLVIVGQAAVDRLIKAHPNVFGVFQAERVTYLAVSDARELIEKPIRIRGEERAVSRYRERAADKILELTGGSAFYIQRFCYQLVEYMNVQRAPLVTEADVEQIREAFLDTLAAKDFDGLESSGYTDDDGFTSEQYRSVLLAVARASRSQPATIMAIRDEYQGPRLSELLDDLVMRDVVRRESGSYRIVVRLYRDWLLKNFGTSTGIRNQ